MKQQAAPDPGNIWVPSRGVLFLAEVWGNEIIEPPIRRAVLVPFVGFLSWTATVLGVAFVWLQFPLSAWLFHEGRKFE